MLVWCGGRSPLGAGGGGVLFVVVLLVLVLVLLVLVQRPRGCGITAGGRTLSRGSTQSKLCMLQSMSTNTPTASPRSSVLARRWVLWWASPSTEIPSWLSVLGTSFAVPDLVQRLSMRTLPPPCWQGRWRPARLQPLRLSALPGSHHHSLQVQPSLWARQHGVQRGSSCGAGLCDLQEAPPPRGASSSAGCC